nr:2TM domain-containing protein [Candidatus Sigynarchaeum springense]
MANSTAREPASPFSDEALRRIAKEKIIVAFIVKVHFLAYIGVNTFLFILDYFLENPGDINWAIIVLSSWLVGLGIHTGAYLIYTRGVIGGNKKGLIFHLIAEVFSIQAVVVINMVVSPAIPWLVWPLGAMTVAILVHVVVYYKFLKGRGAKEQKKSWLDTKIDEELKKARRHA